ncbi:MAG TPA: hypothetical protein VLG71_00335 [Candidatus Limnocylindria bacterium]|nr:hypothetical protein [Candidatus Limnocylindria bacterium]
MSIRTLTMIVCLGLATSSMAQGAAAINRNKGIILLSSAVIGLTAYGIRKLKQALPPNLTPEDIEREGKELLALSQRYDTAAKDLHKALTAGNGWEARRALKHLLAPTPRR